MTYPVDRISHPVDRTSHSEAKMPHSTDGASWTAVSDSTFGTYFIFRIAYGAGKFVAVGQNGKIAYSGTIP